MKEILIVVNNYRNKDLSTLDFKAFDKMCDKYDFNPEYVIMTNKKTGECEKAVTMVFENLNENQALSRVVKGIDMPVVVVSSAYFNRSDLIEKLFAGLRNGYHFVKVKKSHSHVFSAVSEFIDNIYNTFVKLFTGAKDNLCLKNFYAFDETVVEMINEFPNKCALICNSNFLCNLNVLEIDVEPEFKAELPLQIFVGGLISGIVMLSLSIACLVLALVLHLGVNAVVWLVLGFILFGFMGFVVLTKNRLDNKMFVNQKKNKVAKSKTK